MSVQLACCRQLCWLGWAVSDLAWGWIVDRVDLRTAIYTGTIAAGFVIGSLAFVKFFLLSQSFSFF